MTYVSRQCHAYLCEGELASLKEADVITWRQLDVLPKYALVVGTGDVAAGMGTVANGTPETLALPIDYTNASRLMVFIRTTGIVKVTIVSPDNGTSNHLLKATAGVTLGDHPGLLVLCGTVTSIVVTNPIAATTPLVEWSFVKLPDLTAAASYRDPLALGVDA